MGGLVMPAVFVKIDWGRFAGMKKSETNKIVEQACRAGIETWFERFRPLHFGPGAARRYNYRTRTRKYLDRKLGVGKADRKEMMTGKVRFGRYGNEKANDPQPLHFSGESEELTTQKDIRSVHQGNIRAWLVNKAPTFNRKPNGWNYTMLDEFGSVTGPEVNALKAVVNKSITAQLNAFPKGT